MIQGRHPAYSNHTLERSFRRYDPSLTRPYFFAPFPPEIGRSKVVFPASSKFRFHIIFFVQIQRTIFVMEWNPVEDLFSIIKSIFLEMTNYWITSRYGRFN